MIRTSLLYDLYAALGDIGFVSPEVTNALLWCARNDLVPVVRREACNSIACLNITTDNVIITLKDMLELDDDPEVQWYLN